jgi:phosphate transport system substrate-binding protein
VKKAHIGVVPGLQEYLNEFIAEDAIGNDGYLLDAGLVPLADAKRARLQKDAGALMVMSK